METPEQYLRLIDEKFINAKRAKISRYGKRWGIWSAEMNRETRARIKKGDSEEDALHFVFIYWLNRSALLEEHFKRPGFGQATKKRLAREGKRLKRAILARNFTDERIFKERGEENPLGKQIIDIILRRK